MQQALDVLIHTLTAAASVLVALAPILTLSAPLWLPLLAGFIKGEKNRQAFNAVSNACLLALNECAREYRTAMDQAKDAKSDGGETVTPAEKQHALAVGITTGINFLKDKGLLKQVVAVYGSEDAVRLSLESFVRAKMSEQEP